MVNNTMDNELDDTDQKNVAATEQQKRPNEAGSFSVAAHVKIFDPDTQEVFVEKRA